MLHHDLAADPATPPALLRHLVEHAVTNWRPGAADERDMLSLRVALAGNPAVPVSELARLCSGDRFSLLNGRLSVMRAALQRPRMTPETAVDLLRDEPAAAPWVEALTSINDPHGVLVTKVLSRAATMAEWEAILAHPASTQEQRCAAAEQAVRCTKRVSTKLTARITALARQLLNQAITPEEHADAVAWVRKLRRANTQMAPLADVTKMTFTGPPAPGSPAWFRSPRTTVEDVLMYARANGPAAWAAAVRRTYDPTGVIVASAQAAHPQSLEVAGAILSRRAYRDLRALQAAQLTQATFDRVKHVWEAVTHMRDGDPDVAVRLAQTEPASGHWVQPLMQRRDLTSDHLTAVLAMRRVAQGGPNPWLTEMLTPGVFGPWLATYPSATLEQRAVGRAMAQGQSDNVATSPTRRSAPFPEFVRYAATVVIDPSDPDTFTTAALQLPVRTSTHQIVPPGYTWLAGHAIQASMPPGMDDTTARIIVLLGQSFTGSIKDLVTAATVLAD